MASNQGAHGQTHFQWHSCRHIPNVPQQSRSSLPSSPPPPYCSQSSNILPQGQAPGPSSIHAAHEFWRPNDSFTYREHHSHLAPQAQADNFGFQPAPCMPQWAPYEPLCQEHGGLIQNEHRANTWQSLPQSMPAQYMVQAGQAWSPYHTNQFHAELPKAPHMPGASRYLQQQREDQNRQALSADRSVTSDPDGPPIRSLDMSGRNPKVERLGTDQRSKGPPKHTGSVLDTTKNPASQSSSKRSMEALDSLSGSQYAPLQISSSPEPEAKRRKTTSKSQTVRVNPRAVTDSTGPKNYDGFSRQEIAKMLAESTDIKPSKVRYYAVALGRRPGVYLDWPSAEKQVHGFIGAKHKKFKTKEDALAYVEQYRDYVNTALSAQVSRSTAQEPFKSDYYSTTESYESFPPSWQQIGPSNAGQSYVPVHNSPVFAPELEPKLVPEQQHVVDLILQGHNVFYTGSAGCGKSTILKAFVGQLRQRGRRVKIIAPTNLAALNVGGQTTWSFAGWTPDSMKERIDTLIKKSSGKQSWKKFDETDVVVIDEISMIENLQFERLNMILKASRGEKYGGGAFGGIQVIVTGDFHQLAPVKPFSHCMCGWELEKDHPQNPTEYKCTNKRCNEHTFYDIDKWAFRSRAWKECNFKHINLTQIHRQSDMMFKSILNRIRTDGTILKPHAKVLLNHTSETEGAIEIYARRVDVDRVNNVNISKLPSAALAYDCLDNFDWPEYHRSDTTLERNTYRLPGGSLAALKEHRFETRVQLKKDQRVVLQANVDPAIGLVNGAQGTIIEFVPFDEATLPKGPNKKGEDGELRGDHALYRQDQIKQFAKANGHHPWPVVQFTNGIKRTIYADCTVNLLGNEEPWCRLSRTQVPLAAGYAITVHKSQGMTLDRVTVDLARAFEPSQIYVALSRARSLKGLTVTALPRFDLGGANAQVKEFMENIVNKQKTKTEEVIG